MVTVLPLNVVCCRHAELLFNYLEYYRVHNWSMLSVWVSMHVTCLLCTCYYVSATVRQPVVDRETVSIASSSGTIDSSSKKRKRAGWSDAASEV
jgi:hypothetical protein